MSTRKDKTNVAPIYREQVFIPASGATLIKQQARPKIAGRPVSSGAIETVSPEFDLLTGIRGITNLPKGFLKTKGLPKGEELYYRQVARENNPLERAKNIGIIDVKSAPKKDFVTRNGLVFNFGKTFDVPFFSKGDLWYGYNTKYDVIVGKDNPLLDWKTITKGGRVTKPTISNPRRTPYYMEEANQAPTELFELYRHYPGIGYRNVTNGFPIIPITGLNTTVEQMKCGGRRKTQLGLDIREGGVAIPIANNMYYMDGRSHDNGGIAIGPNNKNGLEVEGGEVVKVGKNDVKVFSSVPLLRGVSPAQLVMGGANPNKVFKAQEEFKDRNRINDDGTHYEVGGEKRIYKMPFAQRVQYARTGKITNTGYPITPLQKSYSTLRALGRFRTAIKDRPWRLDSAFDSAIKGAMNDADRTPVLWDKKYGSKALQFVKSLYNRIVGGNGQNLGITKYETEDKEMKAGGIYIKPSKRGTFTAAATKHGMGVQEFASKVLANKEDYSSAMVKKANFARNASRWKKEYGGSMIYTINGNVKNGLSLRPKATLGTKKEDEEKKKKNPNEAGYASRVQKGQAQEVTAKPVVEYNEAADKNPDKYRYTRAAGFKNEVKTSSTGGGTQSKDGRWIGQYKTTNVGDWIGLGSNLAGSVASYFMTKNTINKTPEPIKPVMAQATKLKTRYNVEPQLTNIREAEQMNRAAVRRNTQSSNTSLAREQRLMNEARGIRNTLYGQKENIETQLINQDKVNRQTVYLKNIDNYNNYLNRMYLDKQGKAEARISNINNLISGLTGSVNSILGNIETRRATNNTLRAIAAANPNVDARLIGGFDYYIDPITKKKYNKNQQYVGTINS